MATILSVGVDEPLLYTRRLIMEKSGAPVRNVSPEQARLLIGNSPFDLLVVCHSVRDCEAQELIVAARTASPSIRILGIDTPGAHYRQQLAVDYSFSLEEGPAMLIWAVRRLLLGPGPDLLEETPGRLLPFVHARNAGRRRFSQSESSLQCQPQLLRTSNSLGEAKS